MELVHAFMICLLASVLHCVPSFGFAIISMPILLFPIKKVDEVVAFAELCLNSQIAYKMRKHISLKIVAVPIVESSVGRTMGMNMLMTVKESAFKVCLGISFFNSCNPLSHFLKEKVLIKANIISGSSFGLLSELLGGMFNRSGLPMVMHYLCAIEDKLSYLGGTKIIIAMAESIRSCCIYHIGFFQVLVYRYA